MRQRRLLAIAEGRAAPAPIPRTMSDFTKPIGALRDLRTQMRVEHGLGGRRRSGKDTEKLRRKVQSADRREFNNTKGLVWLVLLNAEQGVLDCPSIECDFDTN